RTSCAILVVLHVKFVRVAVDLGDRRRPKTRAVAAAQHQAAERSPVHTELRIGRRADVAVAVVADRRVELEAMDSGNAVLRADEGKEALGIERIDGPLEMAKHDRRGRPATGGAQVDLELLAFVADRELGLASRELEHTAVRAGLVGGEL